MFVISLLLQMLSSNTSGAASKEFPVQRFFNISSKDIKLFSPYLCTVNASDPKCCSCDRTCTNNCCIDVFWDNPETLKDYLENFVLIYYSRNLDNTKRPGETCEPILHMQNASKIEYVYVKSYTHAQSGEDNAECLRYDSNEHPKVIGSEKRYAYPDTEVYLNKKCASENNVDDSYHLNITVYCAKDPKVSVGMVLDDKLEKTLQRCHFSAFSLYDANIIRFRFCDPFENLCHTNDVNFDLCKVYQAPFRGFKNPHCYRCTGIDLNGTGTSSEDITTCFNKTSQVYSTLNSPRLTKPRPYVNDYEAIITLNFNDTDKNYFITSIEHTFPIYEFFAPIMSKSQSYFTHRFQFILCGNINDGNKYMHGCCSCDPSCFRFKSCCMDMLWNYSNPIDIKTYQKLLIESVQKYRDHKCEKVLFARTKIEHDYYLMVTSCSTLADDYYKEKCRSRNNTTINSQVPVVGSDGYFYRNMYCAKCNFIFDFKTIKIKLICSNEDPYKMVKINGNCWYTIAPDDIEKYGIQSCRKESASKNLCPKDNQFHDLCHSYLGIYSIYANLHCSLCQQNKSEIDLNDYLHELKPCKETFRQVFTWDMLISFTKEANVKEVRATHYNLLPYENRIGRIFEEENPGYKVTARNILKPSFKNCLAASNPYLFLIATDGIIDSNRLKEILDSLGLSDVNCTLYHSDFERSVYRIDIVSTFDVIYDLFVMYADKGPFLKDNDNVTLVITTSNNPVFNNQFQINFSHAFPNNKTCFDPINIDVESHGFNQECTIYFNNTLFRFSDLAVWLKMGTAGLSKNIAVCRKFFLMKDCKILDISNDILIKKNGIVIYREKIDKNITYNIEQYVPTQNGIAVCKKLVSSIVSKTILTIDMYITYIGSTLSIISYMLIITIYCLLKSLRNTPGKCTLSLTVALFIGDSMFLVGILLNITEYNKIVPLCKGVAITMHYFLLLAYQWSVVISFDIMNSVTNMLNHPFHNKKKFYCFCFLTAAISGMVVVAAVVLDCANIVLIGYGENGTCVPHKYYGRLFFYVVPIFTSILFSLIFLTRAIWKIALQAKLNRKRIPYRNKKYLNIALLAFKLVMVLGVSELIGIIQIARQGGTSTVGLDAIFGLIYNFTRSFRGVFLLIAYVCRKHVVLLINESYSRK